MPEVDPAPRDPAAAPGGTVDADEIARFSALADQWWDPDGDFRPLHKLNPVRLQFIRDRLAAHLGRDPLAPSPLSGLEILDVGCGGGLICEPLARLGATWDMWDTKWPGGWKICVYVPGKIWESPMFISCRSTVCWCWTINRTS